MADMLEKRAPLLRKSGVVVVIVVAVVFAALEFLLLDYGLKTGIERGLTMANGAEVNVAQADLSLADGKLELNGLQATDPENPARNLFQADDIAADVAVADLWRKRFVVNLLAVRNVSFDTERETPGRVLEKPKREEPPEEEGETVTDYFEKAEKAREYLQKLRDYLEQREASQTAEEEPADKEGLIKLASNRGYLKLSAKDLIADRPTWVIREVVIEGIKLPISPDAQKIEAHFLSSHPERVRESMTLKMAPASGGDPLADIAFHFEEPGAQHEARIKLPGVSLDAIGLSGASPVDVEDGKADLTLEGTFSKDAINFPFTLNLAELQAGTREGKGFLGLDPDTAGKMLGNLTDLSLKGAITGSLSAPKLELDTDQVLASMKDSLIKAGKEELTREATRQLEAVTKELKEKLPEDLPVDLPGALKDLKIPGLGTKESDEEPDEGAESKDEEEEEEEEKKPADILKGLF
jgi:hypothetical protein